MKLTTLMVSLFLWTVSALAQKGTEDIAKDLLPPKSFDKMIIGDITYAIFGESSPVSGIKVDISKPEGTISGVFQSKKYPSILVGLEFKGGVTDKNFSILNGQKTFNTAFEFRPSLHYIPSKNKAKYYSKEIQILQVKNARITAKTIALKDSFSAVVLIYNKHLKHYPKLNDDTKNPPSLKDETAQRDILIYFIKQAVDSKTAVPDNKNSLTTILDAIKEADKNKIAENYNDTIVETYKKYKKLYESSEDDEISRQIANVAKAWSQKKYVWLTISPFVRTEKLSEYHTKFEGLDSLYFKSTYPVYYGVSLMLNRYRLWPNRVALYCKAGLSFSYANNIASLSSFNHEKITPFFNAGGSVYTKKETGTAYNYDEIKSDFATQFSGEIYLIPLKTFFPGIYFAGSINNSNLYKLSTVKGREDDKIFIPLEGGFVFSINSREKDKEKSLLSLSAYCRNEDITDKIRTSNTTGKEETKGEFNKRNITFGVKVGIPITLPVRND